MFCEPFGDFDIKIRIRKMVVIFQVRGGNRDLNGPKYVAYIFYYRTLLEDTKFDSITRYI